MDDLNLVMTEVELLEFVVMVKSVLHVRNVVVLEIQGDQAGHVVCDGCCGRQCDFV